MPSTSPLVLLFYGSTASSISSLALPHVSWLFPIAGNGEVAELFILRWAASVRQLVKRDEVGRLVAGGFLAESEATGGCNCNDDSSSVWTVEARKEDMREC